MFPRHKCGLHLTHNNHKDYYETVEQYFTNPWMEDTTVSPEEMERMVETDEIWELQWYPDTPIGSYKVIAATFEEVLKKAKEVDESTT